MNPIYSIGQEVLFLCENRIRTGRITKAIIRGSNAHYKISYRRNIYRRFEEHIFLTLEDLLNSLRLQYQQDIKGISDTF
jgi:hypothetical protein